MKPIFRHLRGLGGIDDRSPRAPLIWPSAQKTSEPTENAEINLLRRRRDGRTAEREIKSPSIAPSLLRFPVWESAAYVVVGLDSLSPSSHSGAPGGTVECRVSPCRRRRSSAVESSGGRGTLRWNVLKPKMMQCVTSLYLNG